MKKGFRQADLDFAVKRTLGDQGQAWLNQLRHRPSAQKRVTLLYIGTFFRKPIRHQSGTGDWRPVNAKCRDPTATGNLKPTEIHRWLAKRERIW